LRLDLVCGVPFSPPGDVFVKVQITLKFLFCIYKFWLMAKELLARIYGGMGVFLDWVAP